MSNITRNSQVQAARQRLASRQVPGGAQAGNVAGCGVFNSPVMPPNLMATQDTRGPVIVQQAVAPMGIIPEKLVSAEGITIEVSCPSSGLFYAGGISSCNDCFEIIMDSFSVGGAQINLLCGSVDVGVWNTVDCYCPMDIGCISNISPATITVHAFGTPSVLPQLNMALWGYMERGAFDCGYGYSPYPPGYGGGPGAGGQVINDRYTMPPLSPPPVG